MGRRSEQLGFNQKVRHRKRSPLVLFFLLLVWSIFLGWGMALGMDAPSNQGQAEQISTTDPVPKRYQIGQELYLSNCSTCHIAIPPAVLPTDTWKVVLEDLQQHYGSTLPDIIGPDLQLMWGYLQTFSRPKLSGERTPFRISESRFFKALHPRADIPRPLKTSTCVTCHPGVKNFNFRQLAPEWENAP